MTNERRPGSEARPQGPLGSVGQDVGGRLDTFVETAAGNFSLILAEDDSPPAQGHAALDDPF